MDQAIDASELIRSDVCKLECTTSPVPVEPVSHTYSQITGAKADTS